MLDILPLREDGNPELVRELQRRRYADVGLVDKVIELDNQWRETRSKLNYLNKDYNVVKKDIGGLMKKKETPPPVYPPT